MLIQEKRAQVAAMDDEAFSNTFINNSALKSNLQPLNTSMAIKGFKGLFQLSEHTLGVLSNPANHKALEEWAATMENTEDTILPTVGPAFSYSLRKRKHTGKAGAPLKKSKKSLKDTKNKGKTRVVEEDVSI